jgi:hypothetical protein
MHFMNVSGLCALAIALLLPGCDEKEKAPSQESVNHAWQRSDQAAHQTELARNDVRQVSRLREVDRLRFQAELAELSSQLSTVRGLGIVLSICLLAAMVWLAIELRRRRVVTAVLSHIAAPDSMPAPSGPQKPSSLDADTSRITLRHREIMPPTSGSARQSQLY